MQSGTERADVIGFGSGKFTDGHIITMYEIDKFITGESFEQVTLQAADGIPSHVGNFFLVLPRSKTFHIGIENTQTIDIPLFGEAAHQLHAQANAQHRLTEFFNETIHATLLEMKHGSLGLSHPGKDHFIGSFQHLFIRCNHCFHP